MICRGIFGVYGVFGTSLIGASFIGASFIGTSFIGTSLIGTSLIGASLIGTSFIGISFTGFTLAGNGTGIGTGTTLIGASFLGASFIGTSFFGAVLIGISFGFSLVNGCPAIGISFLAPKLIVAPGFVPIGASFFIVPPEVGTFIFIPGIIISGLLSCEFIFFSSSKFTPYFLAIFQRVSPFCTIWIFTLISLLCISPYSLCDDRQSANILQKNLCFFLEKYESTTRK